MKRYLIVTISALSFALISGQALAAPVEQRQNSIHRSQHGTAWGGAGTHFDQSVESSKEKGRVEGAERNREARAYFPDGEREKLDVWKTVESSKEKGLP